MWFVRKLLVVFRPCSDRPIRRVKQYRLARLHAWLRLKSDTEYNDHPQLYTRRLARYTHPERVASLRKDIIAGSYGVGDIGRCSLRTYRHFERGVGTSVRQTEKHCTPVSVLMELSRAIRNCPVDDPLLHSLCAIDMENLTREK